MSELNIAAGTTSTPSFSAYQAPPPPSTGAVQIDSDSASERPSSPPDQDLTLESIRQANIAFHTYSVNFEIDQKSEQLITKVVDLVSGELIRQIPSEEMLKIAERLHAGQVTPGSLLDEWA